MLGGLFVSFLFAMLLPLGLSRTDTCLLRGHVALLCCILTAHLRSCLSLQVLVSEAVFWFRLPLSPRGGTAARRPQGVKPIVCRDSCQSTVWAPSRKRRGRGGVMGLRLVRVFVGTACDTCVDIRCRLL